MNKKWQWLGRTLLIAVVGLSCVFRGAWAADEKDSDKGKDQKVTVDKSGRVEVGGLYFDLDEGVEIEKGPGGQVLVQSNRDFMKKKFQSIDDRFASLEQRVTAIESKLAMLGASDEAKKDSKPADSGRRVLAT